MKLTNKKIILSGSTIEEYGYEERAVSYDFIVPENSRTREKIIVVDEESRKRKEDSRQRSLYRTSSNLRRLVQANAWQWKKTTNKPFPPVFLTLTFEENIQNIKEANRVFSHFIKRLNYLMKGKTELLKYVVVIEFQKRGAIHYHTIFFNLDYIKKQALTKLWGQGFIKIKAIENVDNAGAYIAKYMSKNFVDERLDSQKRYFSSRNLQKPIEIKDEFKAKVISRNIPKEYIVKEKEFDSAYHGKVKYVQYKLDKKECLFDVIPNLADILR
jgi:hypothetical protein